MEAAGAGSRDDGGPSADPRSTYVLSNLTEVVERVFSFLPAKALLRVASVCRLWSECVRRALRAHRHLTWISASRPTASALGGHCLLHAAAEELERVRIVPHSVLYMADSETFIGLEECRGHKRARKRTRMETALALEKLFPARCHVLGVGTPGIVVTPTGPGGGRPQEVEMGESGFALLFPQVDGVRIQPFHFVKDAKSAPLERRQLAEAGLVDNPELRVVLVFGYNCHKVGAASYLQRVVSAFSDTNIILAGGHVDRLLSFTSHRSAPSAEAAGVAGLALSGPRVQGASVLLGEDAQDEAGAAAALQRLKAAHIPEHGSVGLMFACVGRGAQFYGARANVEADTFRRFFPGVPLFGFFGNGEIGCDRIVTGNFTLSECGGPGRAADADLFHSYTTVVALVHLGAPK